MSIGHLVRHHAQQKANEVEEATPKKVLSMRVESSTWEGLEQLSKALGIKRSKFAAELLSTAVREALMELTGIIDEGSGK